MALCRLSSDMEDIVSSFTQEGDPLEPLHIHVRKAECVAKFWLEPEPGLHERTG